MTKEELKVRMNASYRHCDFMGDPWMREMVSFVRAYKKQRMIDNVPMDEIEKAVVEISEHDAARANRELLEPMTKLLGFNVRASKRMQPGSYAIVEDYRCQQNQR